MRISGRSVAVVAGAFAVGALFAGALVLYTGAYNVAATQPHWRFTNWLLHTELHQSVQRQARNIHAPPLDDPAFRERGLALYRGNCVPCHGAPGIAPHAFALGLLPPPANLAFTAREWRPAELYWVVRHGVKATGMPAWAYRLPDRDLWAVVAFLQQLPKLSPAGYAELVRLHPETVVAGPTSLQASERPGDADRGKLALSQYVCTTCHVIPGVPGTYTPVGPPLGRMAMRAFIAGVLPNTPENMVRWLREPQRIVPQTAMPALGVTEQDARDIAAYLETLQ
jgi:mono/diheme cytochrome c family protein